MSDTQGALFSLAQIQHLMRVEFNRAQRYGYAISAMLIAIDRLGHLRDLYGYEAKEEILEGAVGLLKEQTRSSDFLGRMADDRLLAVVPHTDAEGCRVLAERLLTGARELQFENEDRLLSITFSIGASSEQGGKGLFFDAMLEASENGLYDAQGAGGDRLVLLSAAGN